MKSDPLSADKEAIILICKSHGVANLVTPIAYLKARRTPKVRKWQRQYSRVNCQFLFMFVNA